jgi:hypothetical protein
MLRFRLTYPFIFSASENVMNFAVFQYLQMIRGFRLYVLLLEPDSCFNGPTFKTLKIYGAGSRTTISIQQLRLREAI